MELKEKVVVITGASSGIGMAMATAFAAEGAHLVLAARNHTKLLEITTQLKNSYGIQVIAIATDVSKEIQCKQLMDQALATFGKIDVLINNAGISMRALFEEVD